MRIRQRLSPASPLFLPADRTLSTWALRRRRALFEMLEERHLLAADLDYPADILDASITDLTLRAEGGGATPFLRLYETSNLGNQIAEIQLTAGDDFDVNIARMPEATQGPVGDTLRIDLSTFGLLDTYINANGGQLNLSFIGGDDLPLISDDDVRVEGGGAYSIGYDFHLISSDQVDINIGTVTVSGDFDVDADQEVMMTAGTINATNIRLQSTPETTGEPNADDLTEIIALPTASVSMVGGTLSATNVTLNATATTNLTVNSAQVLNGALNVGGLAVISSASVDINGASDINATGTIDIDAASNVTASIVRGTEDDGDSNDDDKQEDAAVSIATVSSDSSVRVAGTSTLDGVSIDIDSTNPVNLTTTADGQLGDSSAGGTLATAVVLGNTTVLIEGTPTLTATGALTLDADSNRTINTTSIATTEGATEDGDSNSQTQGQQALEDNDAETSDGDMDLAASVAVTTSTGDVLTTISGGTLRSTGGSVSINTRSTNDVDNMADATTTSGSGGTGVGVGAAITVVDIDSKSRLTGAATLEGAAGISVGAEMASSSFDSEAKSGPSGDASGADVSVAGALVIHVAITDVAATIDSTGVVDASNDDLQLSATSTTDNSARAIPAETPSGESIGVGASVAVHIPDQITRAAIENGGSLVNVDDLTLSATSDYDLTTEATSAAAGGTAVAAVVANLVAHEDTIAQIGTGGLLTVGGNLTMTADHQGDVSTKAMGDAEGSGSAAIGAAIAVSVVNQLTEATIARDVTVGGTLSVSAVEEGVNDAEATATAQGAEGDSNDSTNVNDKSGSQRSATDTTADKKGARNSSDTSANGDASTDEGPVTVAAAISINVVDVTTRARLVGGVTLNVTGNASIGTESNADATSEASGISADAGSAGVGAAVAINTVGVTNEATISATSTVLAAGLALQATMKTVAADRKHKFEADAESGAGDGDVGVAGSVSINLVEMTTRALIPSGATVTLSGGDLSLIAEGNTEAVAAAKPEDEGGMGTEVGIGASVALNRVDNLVLAEIEDAAVVGGVIDDLTLTADGDFVTTTQAENGAAGDVAVGAAVAISLPDNDVRARLGSGAAITTTGNLTLAATHAHTVNVTASGDAAGGSVGVGASVAVGVVEDDAQAILARNVIIGGDTMVTSTMDIDSQANAKATAGGNDSQGDDADTEANNRTNNNPNKGENKTLPSASDEANNADSQSMGESSSGSSSVGVAAAIAINFVTAVSEARVENGVSLLGSGQTTIESSAEVDSSAKATGTAVQLSDSDNIGAAVGVNRGNVTNRAYIGNGATVMGSSVRAAAVTTGNESHDMDAWGAAAGGGSGDLGIAGSVGVNIIDVLTEAVLQPGSQVTATSGALDVVGEADVNPQTLAGAVGVSSGTSVGGAVAVTVTDLDTRAIIDGDADAAGVMAVDASTTVERTKFDLPLLSDADDPTATTVAIAGGLSSGDVGVAGVAVVSIYDVDTVALISSNSQINQNGAITPAATQSVDVAAGTDIETFSLAGSLGVSIGAVGVGAGLDLGIFRLNTTAEIADGAMVDADDDITVSASLEESYTGLSTNAGVGNTVGVAGSAAVYVINNTTRADVGNATLDAGGDIALDADGEMSMTIIGGSLAFGSSAGIGAANVTLTHHDEVFARIADGADITTHGTTGLSVIADSSEDIIGTAAAGAGASTAAVAGSAGVIVLNESTEASIGRSVMIDANNASASGRPNVVVTADDHTTIISVAGSLAASGSAAVGLGADVATITKRTEAFIESGVVADVEGNVQVLANSSQDITSVAAGLSASSGVSVATDAAVHVMNLTTRAFVGDDPSDATASAGPGDIDVRGSMNVAADDRVEIDKVVGVLAVATYAGIGAAAAVSTVNKTTEAFIGNAADVTVLGLTPLTVKTGEVSISYTGTSAATPGIEANGDVSLDSNSGTLKAQGEVGLADLDSINADQQGGNDANDQSLTSQRVANLTTTSFRGLAVTATNRDDIETYTISLAGGIAGVAVSAGVNVINTNINSYLGDGATINGDNTGASSAQDVMVASGSDFYHFALAGTLAAGVVGVAPAVGVTVLNNNTTAEIRDGVTIDVRDDVSFKAGASEDILLVGFGLAGGVVGIGGSVDVLSIDNTTTATVGAATISAGGDMLVRAIDNTDLDVISGAVGGGFVGIGASVGVVSVDKVTNAIVGGGATIDALGGGAANSGIFTGEQFGNGSGFSTGSVHGLAVQADSSEDYKHLAIAAGAGFVGVSGGVAVTMIDSDTTALIDGGALINQTGGNAGASSLQSVYVNAANELRGFSFAGALAGGFVGVAGAVDVGSVKNDTVAQIGNGAVVTAENDVEVNALGIKDMQGFTFSGAGGAVALAAAISVWSVGETLDSNYSDNDGNSGNAVEGEGGASATDDAATQAETSHNETSTMLGNFEDDAANPNNSSTKQVGSITADAAGRINAAAPTQAQLAAKLAAATTPSGTTARISGGATVTAGDDINVDANEDVEIDILVGGVAGGFVGVGAGIAVTSIAANTTASAGGTLTTGDDITVRARLDEDFNGSSFVGAGGFVGVGAAVYVVNDTTVVQALLANNATIVSADNVLVQVVNNQDINAFTGQVTMGAVAVGASFVKVNVGNESAIETLSQVGNGARIGFGGAVDDVVVDATSNLNAHGEVFGLSAGIGTSSANFAFVDLESEVRSNLGDNSQVTVDGDVVLTPTLNINGFAEATGTNIGGLTIGATLASVNAGRGDGIEEVVARIGANARVDSRTLQILPESNDDLTADTVAGAGGVISGTGAVSTLNSDLAVVARIAGGADIDVLTLSISPDHSQDVDGRSDSLTIAAGAGTGAFVTHQLTSRSLIEIQSGATTIDANHVLMNARNFARKAQFSRSVRNATVSGLSVTGLGSSYDLGTQANPFEASVTIGNGVEITTDGLENGLFNISTTTDFDLFDSVKATGVSGIGGVTVGVSDIDTRTRSSIHIDGATLQNLTGDLKLATRGAGTSTSDANLEVASGLSANAIADANSDLNGIQRVDLDDATLKGRNIDIWAGRGLPAQPNNHFSRAASNIFAASMGLNIVNPTASSTINETNLIDIQGTSQVLGFEDIDLVTDETSLPNASVGIDGGAFSLSAFPYGIGTSGDENFSSSNNVNVGNSAQVEAGIHSSAFVSIQPRVYPGRPTLPISRLDTLLTTQEKNDLTLPVEIDYEYSRLDINNIALDMFDGHIIQVVGGANAGGTVGNFYQLNLNSFESVPQIPHLVNYNSGAWTDLGVLTPAEVTAFEDEGSPVYPSDITVQLAAGLNDKFYAIKPAEVEDVGLVYTNIGNRLYEEREKLIEWIANHEGNAEAVARYQVQLDEINQQLVDLGFSENVNGGTQFLRSLDVLILDLPDITAAPGSIFIEAGPPSTGILPGQVGNQLVAYPGAQVNVLNNSPFAMEVGNVLVRDNQRVTTGQNGQSLVLEGGNVYLNSSPLTNVVDNTARTIDILQDAYGPIGNYDLAGLPVTPADIDQDLYINGRVINEAGDVTIENREGSVYVNGEVRGENVTIIAAANFTLNSEDWFHTNQDPRQYLRLAEVLETQ
ncbi:MAG: hypothetical protein AAFX06_02860, partial [Planctomycetota bacterium]